GFAPHEVYTSIDLAMLRVADVEHNCRADGLGADPVTGEEVRLAMGSVPLDANLYRQGTSRAVIKMAGSDGNAVAVPPESLVGWASQRSLNRSTELYGTQAALPIDDEGPSITQEEAERIELNKTAELTV